MVGLIPLFAVETFEPEDLARVPGFCKRMEWFLAHNPDVAEHVDMSQHTDKGARRAAEHRQSQKARAHLQVSFWMKMNFYLRTGCARFRNITRIIPSCCT